MTNGTEPSEAPRRLPRWRRALVATLVILSVILVPLAGLSVWVRNLVLDTDKYVETVEPLGQRLGIGVDVVPELRERHLPVVPAGDFERIVRETWRFPTHATADGESNAVAQTRGLTAVRQFIARHAEQPLVVATHGTLMALILNGFDPSFGYEFWRELSFPDVYELEFEASALIRVRRIWDKAA